MRFVCDSCRAQYMISDEKVGPKGVKVRCKKCGFVIFVQKPEPATVGELAETQVMTNQIAEAAAADAAAQSAAAAISSSSSTETSGLFSGVGEDEIGAVFDQVLSGAPAPAPSAPPPDDEEFATTRVVDASTLKQLALAGEPADPPKLEEAPPAPQHDWYVAIEEQQQGPFNLEKIRDLWERGEIGADNLCWRPGFSDWLPLSEVSELAAVLAPRKPVISASTESVASNPVVDTKESSAPAGADATSDWQPSAASALASLVKDEIDSLTQTKAKIPEFPPEPSSPGLIPGLIDAPPPPEDVAEAMTVIRRPAAALESPAEERTRTGARPPLLEPVAAPAAAPAAPFVPPPYAYSAPVAQHGMSKRMIAIIAGVGGLALVLLLVVVYLLGRTERPVEVAVRPPPPPTHQQVTTTPTPPPANPTQPAVAHNPTPTTTPAVAQGPSTTKPTQTAQQTAPATPKTEPVKTEPTKKTEVAQQTPDESAAHTRRERHHRVSHPHPDSSDEVAQAEPPPKPKHSDSNADSAFDAIFGGGGSDSASSTPPPSKGHHHRDVYVPPAPGEDDVPEQLQQSDIMQVVLANKPSIVKCVLEQKRKDPNLSGQLMMRWTITPSGHTNGISVQTSEFKHTYMANCISGLIRGWRFPRHRQQGDPIDFPFTF